MNKQALASIFATALFLALSAMAMSEETPDAPEPWREIASGPQSHIGTTQRVVIRSEEEWRAWWSEHHQAAGGNTKPAEPPKVDFEKETVLAVTLGARKTGGFSISFDGISKDGDKLKVVLKTKSPAKGSMVTMAITKPFAVVAVPKHAGEVEFIEE